MPEKRRTYAEDEDLDFDRPVRARRKKSNTGLILGLSLGGGALLILIVVLALGAGLGWFDSTPPDNPFVPVPNVQGQPKQDPEAAALDKKWTSKNAAA